MSSSSGNTAALGFGGAAPSTTYKALTESYNGTSWTEVNDMNTARTGGIGTGNNQDAALAIGGYSGSYDDEVEQWNGTSWTEVN